MRNLDIRICLLCVGIASIVQLFRPPAKWFDAIMLFLILWLLSFKNDYKRNVNCGLYCGLIGHFLSIINALFLADVIPSIMDQIVLAAKLIGLCAIVWVCKHESANYAGETGGIETLFAWICTVLLILQMICVILGNTTYTLGIGFFQGNGIAIPIISLFDPLNFFWSVCVILFWILYFILLSALFTKRIKK